MAFTTLKKLSVQSAGANAGVWGAGGVTGEDLNSGVMSTVDTIVAGLSSFSVSASNVSLTFTAGGGGDVSNCMWRFTGLLTTNIVVSPTAGDATTYFNGFYMVDNSTTGSFTITLQNGSGSVVLPQGRRCLVYVNTTNSIAPTIIAGGNGDVPTGSSTIWYNTAAPTGWSAVALNDYAVQIVTSGTGGVTSGSVPYSTLFARTATDAHTLTEAEIPLHGHPARYYSGLHSGSSTGTGGLLMDIVSPVNSPAYTGTPDDTAGHQIGGTGGGGSHTHAIDMRVQTAAFTLCTRS